jgi:Cu-Zn family superoxide dismutase
MEINRTKAVAAALVVAALAAGASTMAPAGAGDAPEARARARLIDVTGVEQGQVDFVEQNGQVRVQLRLDGATAGFHGFHVHSTGTCRNPDGTPNFALAGGHYGHDPVNGVVHGRHPGDLPPVLVGAAGTGRATLSTQSFGVADVVGRAVIVHAGPDNLANIPTRYVAVPDDTTLGTGDAGARSYCGVIVAR